MQTTDSQSASSHSHPIHIAVSEGGVINTQMVNEELTFTDLDARFTECPNVGDKDGSYFVRGPLKERCETRADANIEYANLIVLDGDKQYSADTGQAIEGAPDPEQTHQALVELKIPHILATTHSHSLPGKGNKFRILIPVNPLPAEKVADAAADICEKLNEAGVRLVNVPENGTMSQPWYFPRLADADQPYVHFYFADAPPPDLSEVLQSCQETTAEIDRIDAEVTSKPPREADSLPAKYNAVHGSMDQMREMLISHGYELRAETTLYNERALRFCCPGSTTGSAGTVLFQCSDGTARVYSHHGSDPLNEPDSEYPAKDAFDLFRILEHGGNAAAASTAFELESDSRPVIAHAAGENHKHVPRVCEVLGKITPPPVFQRAGSLVRVAHNSERVAEDGIEIPVGTASIHPYRKTTLGLVLSAHLQFGRHTQSSGWIPMDPYDKLVGALLDAYGFWSDIPTLRGISECPILRDDGTLHTKTGYEPTTQLYVEGRVPVIELPETVSRDDALEALDILLSPFREFPFVDTELGRATVAAYIMTLAQRPLLPTAPLFAFSATTPGTGKGLIVELANMIVRGRDAALMPPVGGKDSDEEMRKRLTSVIAYGMSSLNIDNCTRPLGGDALNALMTTTEWTDRQLGTNQVLKMPVCVTLASTGNNLVVRGDMTRRTILTQLDAQVERPEQRVFEERDPVGATRRRRPELLRALFIILKGYQQSGCTDFRDDRLGRFEAWSERVCHPLQWLGLPNPTDSQALLRQEDPEFENLRALLYAWFGLHQDAWMSTADLTKRFGTSGPDNVGKPAQADLDRALLEVAGTRDRVDSKRLGWYLKRNLGRVAGTLRLERKDKAGLVGNHGHQYRVVAIGPQQDVPSSETQT